MDKVNQVLELFNMELGPIRITKEQKIKTEEL
jgi:hypothetical protein